MLLRRVTEHVRTQNWTAIGIDFAIVVIGVFLGIQLGNWNAERLEAQRSEMIVAALSDDFEQLEASAEESVAFHRRALDGLTVVLRAARSGELSEEDTPAFETGLRMSYMRASYMGSVTLNEMIANGQLSLITDPRLRRDLLEYKEGTDLAIRTASEIRELSTMYVPTVTRRFSYDLDSDFGNIYNAQGAEGDGGGSASGFGLSQIGEYDIGTMAADDRFVDAVEELRETQRLWLNLRVINLGRIRRVRERLEEIADQ